MIKRSADSRSARQLAAVVRAGDDKAAGPLAKRLGLPPVLLCLWELGPCGQADERAAATALEWSAALAGGGPVPSARLADPDVIELVADAVELVAPAAGEHPWLPGIARLDPAGCPGVRELLLARAAEGAGRTGEARDLVKASLAEAPALVPAMRDAMEYEMCAGNWARAYELASGLGDEDVIAGPLLRPLGRLAEPAAGIERAARNAACPCGSGRKYKVCCRAADLAGGTHPLTDRSPALYAMLATFAQRAPGKLVVGRIAVCALGAPNTTMLALDLAIFDGGLARRFLDRRGDLLRADELDLLRDWLGRPTDMYEVTSVSRGSEVTLRSMTGGLARVPQRDRLFSLSVGPLDILVGRLLPDGEVLPDGSPYLRLLGLMAPLDRGRRTEALALFPAGPVLPGSDPDFPLRLASVFEPDGPLTVTTAEGEEYRACESLIEVGKPAPVWERLTEPCVPAPEPPVRDIGGYDAYVSELPPRFWTRLSETEVEHVGVMDAGRLVNLGAIERTSRGFKLTANSRRRMTDLTDVVLAAAAAAGQRGKVVRESAKTAAELLGGTEEGSQRDDLCRWLGIEPDLAAVPPRELMLDEHFLPLDHEPGMEAVAASIEREIVLRGMLTARSYDGHTAAEAAKLGGALRDQVLAMIDDCEWRLRRAAPETARLLASGDELRRRIGIS